MKISKKILIIFLSILSTASSGLFAANSDSESGAELRDVQTETDEKTITFTCSDGNVVVPLKSVIESGYIRFLAQLASIKPIDMESDSEDSSLEDSDSEDGYSGLEEDDNQLIAAHSDDVKIDMSRHISVENLKRLVDEYLTPMSNKEITSSAIKEKLEKENIQTLKEYFRVADRLQIPFPTLYLGDFIEFSEACISEIIRKWINQRGVEPSEEFSNFLGHKSLNYDYFSKNIRVINALRKYVDRWNQQQFIGMVHLVAISANGGTVVTGSYYGRTAKILRRNCRTWIEEYTVIHRSNVTSVAVSADGKTIVTGSMDLTAKILRWNYRTRTWDEHTVQHEYHIGSVSVSADGGTVVTGSTDHTTKILSWNGRTWDEKIVQHGDSVGSVSVSAGGGTVVTGSDDSTAKILRWNGRTWDEKIVNHGRYVCSASVSAGGRTVVTGSWDHTAKILRWNGRTWEEEHTVQHGRAVVSVSISEDGGTVVTGSSDNTARILRWNGRTWDEKIVQHTNWVRSVAVSADGGTVVTGSWDETAKILYKPRFDSVLDVIQALIE